MHTKLISGRFSADEARSLLTALTRVKTDFHQHKIKTLLHDEEDIKHSERRIRALEDDLRQSLQAVRETGTAFVDLHATVEVIPVTG